MKNHISITLFIILLCIVVVVVVIINKFNIKEGLAPATTLYQPYLKIKDSITANYTTFMSSTYNGLIRDISNQNITITDQKMIDKNNKAIQTYTKEINKLRNTPIKDMLNILISNSLSQLENTYKKTIRCWGIAPIPFAPFTVPYKYTNKKFPYTCLHPNPYTTLFSQLPMMLEQLNVTNKKGFFSNLNTLISDWENFKRTDATFINKDRGYSNVFYIFQKISDQAKQNTISGVMDYSSIRNTENNGYTKDVSNLIRFDDLMTRVKVTIQPNNLKDTIIKTENKNFNKLLEQLNKCCDLYKPLTSTLDILTTPKTDATKINTYNLLSKSINDLVNNTTYNIIFQLIRAKAITSSEKEQDKNNMSKFWRDIDATLTSYRKNLYYNINFPTTPFTVPVVKS
jgi:hypothetical protein